MLVVQVGRILKYEVYVLIFIIIVIYVVRNGRFVLKHFSYLVVAKLIIACLEYFYFFKFKSSGNF